MPLLVEALQEKAADPEGDVAINDELEDLLGEAADDVVPGVWILETILKENEDFIAQVFATLSDTWALRTATSKASRRVTSLSFFVTFRKSVTDMDSTFCTSDVVLLSIASIIRLPLASLSFCTRGIIIRLNRRWIFLPLLSPLILRILGDLGGHSEMEMGKCKRRLGIKC